MRKIFYAISICVVFFLLGTQQVDAAILDKDSTREFVLKSDRIFVRESVLNSITDPQFYIPAESEEIFLIFNPIVNDELAHIKIEKTLPTISVKDGNGNSMSFTTEIDGQNILVKVPRTAPISFGSPQRLSIEYDSYTLLSKTGAVYDVYVPSFSESFEFEDETSVLSIDSKLVVPKSFGDFNFVVPDKQPQSVGENWELHFSHQELTGILSWIQIGTRQIYEFEITQPYGASANFDLFENRYSVLIPRDVESGPVTQQVTFTELSPEPSAVRIDKDGNLVADYVFPASESGNILIKGFAVVSRNPEVSVEDAGSLSDISSELLNQYTQSGEFWEVNSKEIQAAAQEIKGNTTDVFKLISDTYQYVVERIDYSEVKRFGLNERQGALKTLQGGAAVCMEYSDLFIALMRAQGVPARAAFGYGYDARATNGIDTAHQWAEVYIPKLDAWIAVDTTWGESGPAIIGGDLNHFYKFVASKNPQEPSPVEATFYGSLPGIPDESFKITATDKLPANGSGMSQDDLFTVYPEQPQTNTATSALIAVTELRNQIDGAISTLLFPLGLQEPASSIAKVIIYMSPLFLLMFYYFIRAMRKPKNLPRVVAVRAVAT